MGDNYWLQSRLGDVTIGWWVVARLVAGLVGAWCIGVAFGLAVGAREIALTPAVCGVGVTADAACRQAAGTAVNGMVYGALAVGGSLLLASVIIDLEIDPDQ